MTGQERQQQIGAQEPPSEHDQLAHLVEVEIPRIEAERDALAARLSGLQDTLAARTEALRRVYDGLSSHVGGAAYDGSALDIDLLNDICEIARAALALSTDGPEGER